MSKKVVCFGEMLWDMLPSGKQIGGAPLNVALHLNNLKVKATIISRVGSDDLGDELLSIVQERGLNTDFIQVGKTHLTGIVKANMDELENVKYKIVYPVSWDYIEPNNLIDLEVEKSDIFIFGSLSSRNEKSRNTLMDLLKKSKFNVLDLNLREPYYNKELVDNLIRNANFLKVNQEELSILCLWFGIDSINESEQAEMIRNKFKLKYVCVTLGGSGAILNINGEIFNGLGFSVKVKDTIGSGDAFLAALIFKLLILKELPQNALEFACAFGALVATKSGATPELGENDINQFILKNRV